MSMRVLTFLAFLLLGLPICLQAEEPKIDVKAKAPGIQVEYKTNPTPPPQPVVVEKETVVTEKEKNGCSCNMTPTTTSEQALLSTTFFLTLSLIPIGLRKKDL